MCAKEPFTGKELMSLPIKERFEYRTTIIETQEEADRRGLKLGDTMHIPVATRASVTPRTGKSIVFCRDKIGDAWAPELRDGQWYRMRVHGI